MNWIATVLPAVIAAMASIVVAAFSGLYVRSKQEESQRQILKIQKQAQEDLEKLRSDLTEESQGRLSELERKHEIRRPYLENQMKLYFEATDLVSIISTSP